MTTSPFSFEALYRAYLACRRSKRGKLTALAFEVNAEENLRDLACELAGRTYRPSPSFCFVARNDKHREVFAAPFRDRVVHHLLVRHLEPIWEPVFIHDSYACRKGKGTHAAVYRLQTFLRQATANNTRRAWFAQLDVKAFFPSINRRILLDMILSRLRNPDFRWLAELVILHDPSREPLFSCSPSKWRNVPPHKSLFSVAPGHGLPIGNLTSQFFANVYLNALDQFVKHELKARRYVRYVDDIVLVHEDPELLQHWGEKMAVFLYEKLGLEFHPHRQRLRPASNGIDFLGYIVRASHLLVRRRVVANCRRTIAIHADAMLSREGSLAVLSFPPDRYAALLATVNSYLGVFRHASCFGLIQALMQRMRLLPLLFQLRGGKAIPRWRPPRRPVDLATQYHFYRRRWRGVVALQAGCFLEFHNQDAAWASRTLGLARIPARPGFSARCGLPLATWRRFLPARLDRDILLVLQTGAGAERLRTRGAVVMVTDRSSVP